MGLFDFFKKRDDKNSNNGILGPTFLENHTKIIEHPKKLLLNEWRRNLISKSGKKKFQLEYYGELHKTLIVGTEFSNQLVYAIDTETKERILIFDGCKHGYNSMLCDTFTDQQIKNRPTSNLYKDKDGNTEFDLTISTYYGIDYKDEDEEFLENVDKNGNIQIKDGNKIKFEELTRNGFCTLLISGKNKDGKIIKIISEELS